MFKLYKRGKFKFLKFYIYMGDFGIDCWFIEEYWFGVKIGLGLFFDI